jgi:Carboxypeptidase regulatory-like domain
MLSRMFVGKFGVAVCGFMVVAITVLETRQAYAQVAGATLSGTVTDASGAVVPQAQILIKNVATGISTTAPTNADGLYSAPNLLPGNYDVTASATGFRTEVRSGISLTVGAQQVLNIALQVGQTTQEIQVEGAAPTVELASSTINAVVNSNTIVDLLLNGPPLFIS